MSYLLNACSTALVHLLLQYFMQMVQQTPVLLFFFTKIFRYNYRNISNELLQQTPLNIYGAHIHIPGSILVYLFLLLVIHKELSLAQLVASVGVQPHQPIMSQL